MIIRREKRSERFSVLNTEPIEDKNLSAVALGIYVYIMSKPDNWNAHKNEILKRFGGATIKTSKNVIDSAFSELIKAGYIVLKTVVSRTDDNKVRFAGKEYLFFDTPQLSKDKNCRETEIMEARQNSKIDKPRNSKEMAHITNTDLLTNINIITNTDLINKEKSDFSFSENSQSLISLNDKKELEKVNRANFVNDKESEPAENAKYYFEVTQVLELLTERSGVKYKIPKTKLAFEKYEPYKLIKERINDKATLEDIFAVVEMKNKEWAGTQIYKNFVPSTLFRKSNFDKYLQQLQLAPKINQQPKQQIYPEPEFKIFTGEGIDLTKDPSYMPELGW